MPALLLFATKYAALFVAVVAVAAVTGTAVLGKRFELALRAAAGLAVLAYAFFFAALAGALRWFWMPALVCALIISLFRVRDSSFARLPPRAAVFALPLIAAALLMAIFPPLAFDETLYHLPFVRVLEQTGRLALRADMRFPAFPQFHELLCAPLFLIGGDVATHLAALAETVVTAALLWQWGSRRSARCGALAAAFFVGSPIVLHLATITYVDAALTLFVCTAFFCLDHGDDPRWQLLAGAFLGAACSVKYLGWYFAFAAIVFASRRLLVAAATIASALPVLLWLFLTTGNPVFPFFGASPWSLMPLPQVSMATRILRLARLAWDGTFARSRVNTQPPFTPFLIVAAVVIAAAALRDRRARDVALIAGVYCAAFEFLPQDSRYLVSLLPLISIAFAEAIADRLPRVAALAAAAPTFAYAGYVLAVRGLPPATPQEREALLRRRIPEYAALQYATGGAVYACGGEQLKYYAPSQLLGDFNGPFAFDRVLRSTATIEQTGVRYFLISKKNCPEHPPLDRMRLVYDDSAAQLWELQRSHGSP